MAAKKAKPEAAPIDAAGVASKFEEKVGELEKTIAFAKAAIVESKAAIKAAKKQLRKLSKLAEALT